MAYQPAHIHHDGPVITHSTDEGVAVYQTTHATVIGMIEAWLADTSQQGPTADQKVMGEAAIVLIKTDKATGISLAAFDAVEDLVNHTIALAYGFEPKHASVRWERI